MLMGMQTLQNVYSKYCWTTVGAFTLAVPKYTDAGIIMC